VFLDEMTTGLDPASRRVAWELIRRIREQGATVVLVTHFMDEAETLCDRLAVVDDGRVIAEGSPQGLIDRYGEGVRVRFSADGADLSWLAGVSGVREVLEDRGRYEVRGDGPLLANVAAALVGKGIAPLDLRAERATLEDVFLSARSPLSPHQIPSSSRDRESPASWSLSAPTEPLQALAWNEHVW
jgi:ABC-2 type transport system ATP-binding protein